MPRISSCVGFAVAMESPWYICMESAEMTSPFSRFASSTAREVLPEAVAPTTAATFTPEVVAKLAYVILLATIFAIIMQNTAQAHVESAQAALLMSFESVFGVVFSIIFYHEQVTVPMLLGFGLIFAAILVSELVGRSRGGSPHETEEQQS